MPPPETSPSAPSSGKSGVVGLANVIDLVPVEDVADPDAVWFAEITTEPETRGKQASFFDVETVSTALSRESWCGSQPAHERLVRPISGCFARLGMGMVGATMMIHWGASALLPLVGASSYSMLALRIGAGAALGLGGGVAAAVILIAVAVATRDDDGTLMRLPGPGAIPVPRANPGSGADLDALAELPEVDPRSPEGRTLSQWDDWVQGLETSLAEATGAAGSSEDWQQWYDAPNCTDGFDNAWRGERCPEPSSVLKFEPGVAVALVMILVKFFTWDYAVYCLTNPLSAWLYYLLFRRFGVLAFLSESGIDELIRVVSSLFASSYGPGLFWFQNSLETTAEGTERVVSGDGYTCGSSPVRPPPDATEEDLCGLDLPILCCADGVEWRGKPVSKCASGLTAVTSHPGHGLWKGFAICECVPG